MHERESNPAPYDFLSERLTSELGRPSSEVKRSDKKSKGAGFDSRSCTSEKKDLFSDSYVTKYSCNDLQTSKNQYGKTDARKPKSKRRLREPGRSRAWKNTRCNSRRPLWCRTQRKKSTKSESRRRLRAGGRPGIAQKSSIGNRNPDRMAFCRNA